ncbi:MAG: response regulator [Campylobacterota bacterium]|nr:response regulator [Campylobacterota bacterium]
MSLKYLGNKNILVVEDDVFNIQLIRSLLGKISDMNIISSCDGAEALDILLSKKVNIEMVLLDIYMPIMDGKELLTRIRNHEEFNNLPILIISVDNHNEDELRLLGANDFIHKPFNIDKLADHISKNFTNKA